MTASMAVQVESLAKRYRIGLRRERYRTARDTLARGLRAPFSRLRGGGARAHADERRELWALRDVSLEIARGDVVAIIGQNGAGKSTLLRILSRITEPTSGYADVHGRVGSLLEVGAGFHQELTGRENIYLNGAILGMRRAEIRRRFDEIVEFAEVERFVDTPVKHYSSGMYLRLAFAVAAHLEPDILLVDEVLTVGDAAFQRRCLGKMGEVSREGRTVLFVSHNMGAVRSLCRSGIVLEQGRVGYVGEVGACVEQYYRAVGLLGNGERADGGDNSGAGGPFGPVRLETGGGNTVAQSDGFVLRTVLRIPPASSGFTLRFLLEDMHGRHVVALREESLTLLAGRPAEPSCRVAVQLPPLWLRPGLYSASFRVQFWGNLDARGGVSEKFPLDVAGSCGASEAILQPPAAWSVQPGREN